MEKEYCLTVVNGVLDVPFKAYQIYHFTSIELLNAFVDDVINTYGDILTVERSDYKVKLISSDLKNCVSLTWETIKWNPTLETLKAYR